MFALSNAIIEETLDLGHNIAGTGGFEERRY